MFQYITVNIRNKGIGIIAKQSHVFTEQAINNRIYIQKE